MGENMGRQLHKLSALAVTKATERGYFGDGGGLWLQVARGGSKSWVFRWARAGKQREMGLGGAHTVSLAEARAKARECRQKLLDGLDPIEVREAADRAKALERARAMTFDQCAEAYIAAQRHGWRNEKHAAQWTSTLEQFAYPVVGDKPVADVGTDDNMEILRPILEVKTETASRLRSRLELVLSAAKVQGHRTGENPATWRGHLDALQPPPGRVKAVTHHPALPYSQAPAFMAALAKVDGVAARALEFAIFTAARSAEVRLATWEEFDLPGRLWAVPASRMKARVALPRHSGSVRGARWGPA